MNNLTPQLRLKRAFRRSRQLGWQAFAEAELIDFAAANPELAELTDELIVQEEFEKKQCLEITHFCVAVFLHCLGYLPLVQQGHIDFIRQGLAAQQPHIHQAGFDYLNHGAYQAMFKEYLDFVKIICCADTELLKALQKIVILIAAAVCLKESDLHVDQQVQDILKS